MMPGNLLSTYRVPASWSGARGLAVTATQDFEDGGVALNDPSQGLLFQVWRALLIDDEILVDAPNTPQFVLYSAPGITEVSLTFDQNMRPALAFVQGGVAKLRWYDSTVGDQVVTDLPAGAVTPRVFLDDKRAMQTADSDVLLFYVRDGSLYMSKQRERFEIEHLLEIADQVGIIKVGFSSQLRVQILMDPAGSTSREVWPSVSARLEPMPSSWAGASVVAEVCDRAGVPAARIKMDRLGGTVDGFSMLNTYDAYTGVEALGRVLLFDPANWDGALHFVPRGQPAVATLTRADLVDEGDKEIAKLTRRDAINVPRVLQLEYFDIDGGLQADMQTSDRSLDARSKSESKSTTTVLMRAPDAARTAVVTHKISIEEQRGEYSFALPDSWLPLTPSDVVMLDGERLRLTDIRIDQGMQKYKASFDRASAYVSFVNGVPAAPISEPPTLVVGDTVLQFIDSHILRDADDRLGYYIAISGVSEAWGGAVVELSTDGGANYVDSSSGDADAFMGELEQPLAIHPHWFPDAQNTLQVRMLRENMVLEETDAAGMQNRINLAIVGDELINFANADEVEPGLWDLSNLLRGRKGSAVAAHPAGTRFVMLDRSTLAFIDAELFNLGQTLTFRVTTFGSDESTVASHTFVGRSQTEREVGYLSARAQGGSLRIYWQGAGRLGGGARVAMGQHFAYYEVSVAGTIYTTAGQLLIAPLTTGVISVRAYNRLTGFGPSTSITVT